MLSPNCNSLHCASSCEHWATSHTRFTAVRPPAAYTLSHPFLRNLAMIQHLLLCASVQPGKYTTDNVCNGRRPRLHLNCECAGVRHHDLLVCCLTHRLSHLQEMYKCLGLVVRSSAGNRLCEALSTPRSAVDLTQKAPHAMADAMIDLIDLPRRPQYRMQDSFPPLLYPII